jgi:hypothetical protein
MTYSGDPADSGLNAVRFWAQDTGDPPLLADAEIEYLSNFTGLDIVGEPVELAAVVADRIAAKYAGEVSISSDGVTYSGDQLQTKYNAVAKELRNTHSRVLIAGAYPFVGGLQRSRNFGVGMHDTPRGAHQVLEQSGDDQLGENIDDLTGRF